MTPPVAGEALRMPGGGQGLDDSAHNELGALGAAAGEQHLEVMFAILPLLKLKIHPVLKRENAGWRMELHDSVCVVVYVFNSAPSFRQS